MGRLKISRLYIIVFAVALAQSFFFLVPTKTFAAYDPGQIISDAELTAKDSMSEADIQAWLVAKNSSLATMTVPTARTVTYYIGGHNPDGSDRTLTTYENTVVGPYGVGPGFEENVATWPISKLIWKAAQWYTVNPQVILTIIQKESIYITRTDGAAMATPGHNSYATYAWLMGYAYTEDPIDPAKNRCGTATPGANPTKSCAGIAAQIDNAAWAVANWANLANIHDTGNRFTCNVAAGAWEDYYWSNDAFRLCDDEWVTARSGATAALYRYTPHTGLTGGYTGNKGFYSIYTNWFVPLPIPPLSVYRFLKSDGTHFYTASVAEKDNIIAKWPTIYKLEGVAYTIDTTNPLNNTPLYRFYNMKDGTHFYTASEVEKNNIIAKWPTIYWSEGISYKVSAAGGAPIYRFYKSDGTHFFTASAAEKDNIIARWPLIYGFEGIGYYIY